MAIEPEAARRHRMSPDQLGAALAALGYTPEEFARITGTSAENVHRALHGEVPIPAWMPLVTGLLTLKGAREMAEAITGHFAGPSGA